MDCEVAVTISPKGWKKVKREWLDEFTEEADNYYEARGWQLWYWEKMERESLSLIHHAMMDVPKEEFRIVSVDRASRIGEETGEVTGPFDLSMGKRDRGYPEDWIHIDPEYGKYFFRED